MNAAELQRRIELGEDSETEFKGVVSDGFRIQARALAREVAALANLRGGLIVVGVEDDGAVTGTGDRRQTDDLMLQVSQAVFDNVEPSLTCPIRKVQLEGTNLLTVDVPAFAVSRPFAVGGRYPIRDASRVRNALPQELTRLLESATFHLDERPVEGAAREDLDEGLITAFAERVGARGIVDERRERWLWAIKCLTPDAIPTVAGVLFFGREPERWRPEARVSAVRFEGTRVGAELADRVEISGPLPEQLVETRRFLDKHLDAPARLEDFERVEGGLPRLALREALANALAHRDYRASSQTRVFVFDDRVEIDNPGTLLNSLTLDNVREGISQPRNPVVSSLLARGRGRESLGIGIPVMFEEMRERGLPEPELELRGGHFRVVLRRHASGTDDPA